MKKTTQYGVPNKAMRKALKTERMDPRGLEDEGLAIPAGEKGFTTPKMPGPDANNKGPALPPLPKGRNWNATRPKAPQAAK